MFHLNPHPFNKLKFTLKSKSPTTAPPLSEPWDGLRARHLYLTIRLLASQIHQRERLLEAELASLAVRPPPSGIYDNALLESFQRDIDSTREDLHRTINEFLELREGHVEQMREEPRFYTTATRNRCIPVLEPGFVRFVRSGEGMGGGSVGVEWLDQVVWGDWVEGLRNVGPGEGRRRWKGKWKARASAAHCDYEESSREPAGDGGERVVDVPGPIVRDFAYPQARFTPAEESRAGAGPSTAPTEESLKTVMEKARQLAETVDLKGVRPDGRSEGPSRNGLS